MEPSTPFHKLVKNVDAKDNANEKIHVLDVPRENNNVTSILESRNLSAETYG